MSSLPAWPDARQNTRRRRLQRVRVEEAVSEYLDKGWLPVPLPARQKFPPPAGFTGQDRRVPTPADYRKWAGAWGNLALPMPDGVIGLDADLYKTGNRWPDSLPHTVRSTSRDDGSGIYLFRVPAGTRLQGSVPGVGEVIQAYHRYAVAWPSIHPEGRRYRWVNADESPSGIPWISDLPELPPYWRGRLADRSAPREANGYGGTVDEWLAGLPDGPMSRRVRAEVRHHIRELRRAESRGRSRYDAMVRATAQMAALGASRHRGIPEALDEIWAEYAAVIGDERDAEAELYRAVAGAVAKFGGAR